MKNFNLDFENNEKLNHLYEDYTINDYDYNTNNLDEDVDNPKGWSYVCLSEVINYYINQN